MSRKILLELKASRCDPSKRMSTLNTELDVYQPPICKPRDKDNWMLDFGRIWANVASDNCGQIPERSLERLQDENDH